MRLTLSLVLLGVALPAFAAERTSKARVSANGAFSVRLVEVAPGQCRLEMLQESGVVWQFSGCIGTVNDLYFASNDGERVWVLMPLVEKGKRSLVEKQGRRKVRVPAWANAPVAALYGRTGEKLKEMRLPELMAPKQWGEVRQLQGHFKWLEGTLGIPGTGPRLTDDEKVEFEPVASKTQRLSF
ncbi:hypothetical protein [Stigmatella aurantiaca]|uniref:Conserved uncharacterized protein n=1 Tax=Stigmatella aurantiaca (strain DW4/3-1) TaxID=378806 RepID=E3FC25_STIAD|nr:hypothetical protein [Stigmatella aurantiaca]ADO68748.1 conserved uncharacterized protein [Stigmatella aurantiaca DW4/3-1]